MAEDSKKILVLRFGALGDIVHTTASIKADIAVKIIIIGCPFLFDVK